MKRQYVDTACSLLAVVVTVLNYLQVGPGQLTASIGPIAQAAVYVVAGALIGWCVCRIIYSYYPRLKHRHGNDSDMSFDEFAANFASAPYDIKAFLKTVVLYGAAYMRTGDLLAPMDKLQILNDFVDSRTIRNNITKYVLNEEMKKLLKKHPELLEEVSEEDLKPYEFIGVEGDLSYRERPFELNWWYYAKPE